MCCQGKKKGCQKPENLKGTPEECSPEQIRACHGEQEEHPCVADPQQADEETRDLA